MTFYITTAISYVNGKPHLGHAYEAVATDAVARFYRQSDADVMFLTGTDEHGQKVAKAAEAEGLSPKEFSDINAQHFKDMQKLLNISHDRFIRTTEPNHYEASKYLWEMLEKKGDVYLDQYEGWYSIRDEAYFDEKEITEEDGQKLAPTGNPVTWVVEPSYFFRLSKYTQPLLDYYNNHPDFIQPEFRRNEVVNFVKSGLKDLSISRTNFKWGVPVPSDEDHVMYVWLDALTNYLTGVNFPNLDDEQYKKFWPANLHIIGKDILRFHCIYWPAFLLSAGIPLPKKVFGHGFLNIGGKKMSKSLGNVVTPDAMVQKYGLDPLRYVLLREVPFGRDGSLSHEDMLRRINGDLANDIGNFCQRTLAMIAKHFDGKMPDKSEYSDAEDNLHKLCEDILSKMQGHIDNLQIHLALQEVHNIVIAANKYFNEQQPWSLIKTDKQRCATVLYASAQLARKIGILYRWAMPDASDAILDQVGIANDKRKFSNLFDDTPSGTELPQPKGVFPRYSDVD